MNSHIPILFTIETHLFMVTLLLALKNSDSVLLCDSKPLLSAQLDQSLIITCFTSFPDLALYSLFLFADHLTIRQPQVSEYCLAF